MPQNNDEFLAELEQDLSWRMKELNFFRNNLDMAPSSDDGHLARAMHLVLYAHFEGFCKFTFLHYIRAINDNNLDCTEVISELAVASMEELFRGLENPDRVARGIPAESREDGALRRFSRRKEFYEDLPDILDKKVHISDRVVYPEDNLNARVLRKILYRLGISIRSPGMMEADGFLHRLVNARHDIAHGNPRRASKKDVLEIYEHVIQHIQDIKNSMYEIYTNKSYLRS